MTNESDNNSGVPLYEAIATLLMRVSSLEKMLVEKKIMTIDEYHKFLEASVAQMQDMVPKIIAEASNKTKIFS